MLEKPETGWEMHDGATLGKDSLQLHMSKGHLLCARPWGRALSRHPGKKGRVTHMPAAPVVGVGLALVQPLCPYFVTQLNRYRMERISGTNASAAEKMKPSTLKWTLPLGAEGLSEVHLSGDVTQHPGHKGQ